MRQLMHVIFSILVLISCFSLACVGTNQAAENKSIIISDTSIGKVDTIDQQRYLLKYDNGVFSGSNSKYDPRGQCVLFAPPVSPFKIQKVYVRGYRTDFPNSENKTYTIKIWDGNFRKELFSCDYPYSRFSTDKTVVAHTINPPVIVTDNFTVDFISHSEGVSEGEKPKIAIYVSYDNTLDTSNHLGVSWLGTYDSAYLERAIKTKPEYMYSSWIIQAEGTGQAIAGHPQAVVNIPENISAVNANPGQSLFFQDDFSNPDSGWRTDKWNSGSFQYDNGSYLIDIHAVEMHSYSKNKNISALRDLIVEVDVVMEVGGPEQYAELIAGWVITKPQLLSPEESRPGNYYFHIYPVQETAEIFTWEQAEWGRANKNKSVLLFRTRYTAVNAGKQNNKLRFVFKGNKLKAYLNNKLMVDAVDENILFGHRLMDLGLVEGKFIYLGAGSSTICKFDNFKLYRGTQKAFLVPEELKDTGVLKERIMAAEDYGFDIGPIEYYGKADDYKQAISKLRASQPVAIQILCQPGEKAKMEASMAGYTGEAIYDVISLTDYVINEFTVTNSSVKKGETLKASITAKNTGYLPIEQLSCNYAALDIKGNIIFSGKTEILNLPAGKDCNAEISQGIPLLSVDGDYTLKVDLSSPDPGNSGQAITREKESTFSISGISPGIITGIVVSVIVLLGIAVAVFFVIKKKPKKKISA